MKLSEQILANQVAIMSALVEIVHAMAHGGQVSAGTIEELRSRVRESERQIAGGESGPILSMDLVAEAPRRMSKEEQTLTLIKAAPIDISGDDGRRPANPGAAPKLSAIAGPHYVPSVYWMPGGGDGQ